MTDDANLPARDIAIIILAAGSSSRLGRPKQLLEYRGQTLIRRAVDSAVDALLCPTLIVTSPHLADAIRVQVPSVAIQIITNSSWKTGMSSSIRSGLSHLIESMPALDAVIIALCDQPEVTSETFLRLVRKYRETGSPIVASEYDGAVGVPALFDNSMIGGLLALTGEKGAKALIARSPSKVVRVPAPEAALDIDTAADLDALTRR